MSVQIKRNPFTRSTLFRTVEAALDGGCAWCGSFNGFGGLFRYFLEQDAVVPRKTWVEGAFCSTDCLRCYHENSPEL